MKAFAELFIQLDETTKTKEKVHALATYFRVAAPADAAWGLYFLSGRKLLQPVPTKRLRAWIIELSGIPEWLFAECYESVGDLAETITLLLPPPKASIDLPLQHLIEQRLIHLRGMDEEQQKQALINTWMQMDNGQRFVWNKLITGQFRVGVSQALIIQGIAKAFELEKALVAHRLMGQWQPSQPFWEQLISEDEAEVILSQPYPFCLANPLLDEVQSLGDIGGWQAEWKWDGIRAQLIKREGQIFIWSRGEELVTEQFPEIAQAAIHLPDGLILDGEILPWQNNQVGLFALLQRRLGRKTLSKRLLQEIPVVFYVYDLLELAGEDIRHHPLSARRLSLEGILTGLALAPDIQLSPIVPATSWDELANYRLACREHLAEGLMLKHKDSGYLAGRQRGAWWKWKIDPYTVDAVLIAAQRGHGRRAGLYSDYTFAVWANEHELVPFAKAYSGLTDKELHQVDAYIKRNTLQKFGPVRSVKAELVFEIAFEAIQLSKRHKSGVAVRFPRILRWRLDKTAAQADRLATLHAMISNTIFGKQPSITAGCIHSNTQ